MQAILTVAALSTASAFVAQSAKGSSALAGVRSKSVPFLEQPAALDGTLAGDVGFDPLGLSSKWSDKDWSQQVVPDIWASADARTPISTIQWMRESELEHGRLAMLAVLGWVAVDAGIRFPGEKFESIPNSFVAHDAAVANGSMGFLLVVISVLEIFRGAAIYDQAKGSGRAPGDFGFDPLGLSKKDSKRYATNEIKNGRLAMLAISGILTQQALFTDKSFPFL